MTEFIEECIGHIFNSYGMRNLSYKKLSYMKDYCITSGTMISSLCITKDDYSIELLDKTDIIFKHRDVYVKILCFEKEYKRMYDQLIMMIEDAIHGSIEEFVNKNEWHRE